MTSSFRPLSGGLPGRGVRRSRSRQLAAVMVAASMVIAACGDDDDGDSDDAAQDTAAPTATEPADTEPADTEPADTEAPDEDTATTEPAAEDTTPSEPAGDPVEFVVGIGQDLPILDGRLPGGSAASFSALRHIAEPLVFFSPEGEFVPKLAESWERVDDTTWRFTLREGVTFHNGEPWNADAAKFSIDQAIDPDLEVWHRFATGSVLAGAEVVDEYTVDITTQTPTESLPNVLTAVDMVPPEYVGEDQQNQNTAPVGTGPFTFVSFTPRSELVLERNDDYWGELPSITNLTFRIIPEASTRVAALQAGEVHMINSISPENLSMLEAEGLKIESSPTTRTVMIALRSDQGVLANPLVRQAMNYAVNKEEIVSTLLNGIAEPLIGPMATTLPGALTDLEPYSYDPERAEALLAEAGYADEPITIAIGAGRYPNDDLVGLAVVDQLMAVGLNIDLQAIDYSAMLEETAKREDMSYNGWIQGWGASLLLSAELLNAFFAGPDASLPLFYSNPEYTAAMDAYASATDDDARNEALAEAQRVVWEDAGGLFLYVPVENLAMQANVENVPARFDEFFFVDQATIGE
jgi:peptide/nickel transport system substrate-binding protein